MTNDDTMPPLYSKEEWYELAEEWNKLGKAIEGLTAAILEWSDSLGIATPNQERSVGTMGMKTAKTYT